MKLLSAMKTISLLKKWKHDFVPDISWPSQSYKKSQEVFLDEIILCKRSLIEFAFLFISSPKINSRTSNKNGLPRVKLFWLDFFWWISSNSAVICATLMLTFFMLKRKNKEKKSPGKNYLNKDYHRPFSNSNLMTSIKNLE